jgi:hypothetical protein
MGGVALSDDDNLSGQDPLLGISANMLVMAASHCERSEDYEG